MKKILLLMVLISLFTTMVCTERDYETHDLYYNRTHGWTMFDANGNQQPVLLTFGYAPTLNLHYSFNEMLIDRILMFSAEGNDDETVTLNIKINDIIIETNTYSFSDFSDDSNYQLNRLVVANPSCTGLIDIEFEFNFNNCSYWPSNGSYTNDCLLVRKSFYILDEYKNIRDQFDFTTLYNTLINSDYSSTTSTYTNEETDDEIIYSQALSNETNSSIVMIEGFDIFGTNSQYSYFTSSEIYNQLIQNNDVYYIRFKDTHKDLRESAMFVASALNKINSVKTDSKPMTIFGFSAGGVIARFALSWMEQNEINHFTNHLVMVDSPLRGAWINQDLQSRLYNMTMDAEGSLIESDHASLIATSVLKNMLRSPAARQLLRNNRYAEGLNIDSAGSLDSNYFYSYLNQIDNNYYSSMQNVSYIPSTLNNDISHVDNKPGYPYKQNNIICSAVSLGTLISNESPAIPGNMDELLGFNLSASVSGNYSVNVGTFDVVNGFFNQSLIYSETLECNDDSDFWPGSKLGGSFDGASVDELISYAFNSALVNAGINIDIQMYMGLYFWKNPTFVPTFSSLDIQSSEFDFSFTRPENIPRTINITHLNDSPISLEKMYYQVSDHQIHQYSSYDYSQLINHNSDCFLQDYIDNSNNPNSTYGIPTHIVSGIVSEQSGSNISTNVKIFNINQPSSLYDFQSSSTNSINEKLFVWTKNPASTMIQISHPSSLFYETTCLNSENFQLNNVVIPDNLPKYLIVGKHNGVQYLHSIEDAFDMIKNYLIDHPNDISYRFTVIDNSVLSEIAGDFSQFNDKVKIAYSSTDDYKVEMSICDLHNADIILSNFNMLSYLGLDIYDIHNTKINFNNVTFELANSETNTPIRINYIDSSNCNELTFNNCKVLNHTVNFSPPVGYGDGDFDTDYSAYSGAIQVIGNGSQGHSLYLKNCEFTGNSSCVAGMLFAYNMDNLKIEDCLIKDNSLIYRNSHVTKDASAIVLHHSRLDLSKSLIIRNGLNNDNEIFTKTIQLYDNSFLTSKNNTYYENGEQTIIQIDETSTGKFNDDIFTTINNNSYCMKSDSPDSEFNNIITHNFCNQPIYIGGEYFTHPSIDPMLDENLSPIWNRLTKSPAIDAAGRVNERNNDIGAKQYTGNKYHIHELEGNNQWNWVSFPYLWVNELENNDYYTSWQYIFNELMNNKLLNNDPGTLHIANMNSITNGEAIDYFSGVTNTDNYKVCSQYGYKIRLNHEEGNATIQSSGFAPDGNMNAGQFITDSDGNEFWTTEIHINRPFTDDICYPDPNLPHSDNNMIRPIYLGYWLEEKQSVRDLLDPIWDDIVYVKHKKWSYDRIPVLGSQRSEDDYTVHWMGPGLEEAQLSPEYQLVYPGEMIEVGYIGNEDASFAWTNPHQPPTPPSYVIETPIYFGQPVDPTPGYVPIYVNIFLDEYEDGNKPVEIAIYVDGVCKGSSVIKNDQVQLLAFVTDEKLKDELSDIQFHLYFPGIKSAPEKITEYKIFDRDTETYVETDSNIHNYGSYMQVKLNSGEEIAILPEKISLEANYPNPFNPTTNISFGLPVNEEVKLDVYNIKGQKVKALVNDKLEAGIHKVTWNGENSKGQKVASGVYFYRLSTNKKQLTRKMIMMK